jgi:hypothetical protein
MNVPDSQQIFSSKRPRGSVSGSKDVPTIQCKSPH